MWPPLVDFNGWIYTQNLMEISNRQAYNIELILNLCFYTVLHILVTDLVKNQKLPANILTPTTKAADHDVPVTPQEVWIPLHSILATAVMNTFCLCLLGFSFHLTNLSLNL